MKRGTSIRETAAIFNIPSYETGGLDALHSKKKERPTMKDKKTKPVVESSIEALQVESERLRMENAYLKKWNALVQNKKQSPDKAQVIYELKHEFPVKELLQLANIRRSTYY